MTIADFTTWFLTEEQELERFATNLLRDKYDAKTFVQQAFIKQLPRVAMLLDTHHARSSTFLVITNLIRTHWRKTKKEKEKTVSLPEYDLTDPSTPRPDAHIMHIEDLAAIPKVVNASIAILTAKECKCILARLDHPELSDESLADQLRITKNAFTMSLFRAKTRISELFETKLTRECRSAFATLFHIELSKFISTV